MPIQGIWEQTVGGASKRYYTFNGQVVAMRDTSTNAVTYLHGDHLGSVSLATNSSGAVVSKQDFDPWGKARGSSTIAQTSLNYTSQRLDGTGLLYYHARYYDPALARFVSADTIVPGSASGGMDGVALKGLTVDFHEPGFVGQIAGENNQPFWFQLSDQQRQQAGSPWGPANPQALNRYSYVQNNPLGATDPSGHTPQCTTPGCGAEVINNSNESVEVQGNRYIQGCDAKMYGTGCWEAVQVRLDPGESSADYGLTDVDRVRAMPGNTIAGQGHDKVIEVSDGMRVNITSSSSGGSVTCFGSYGWKCVLGLVLKAKNVRWDQLPGSYPAEKKWWPKGYSRHKPFILPSKRDGSYRGNE